MPISLKMTTKTYIFEIGENLHFLFDFFKYDYLCENGECFYIEYEGKLCGDISLRNNGEIAIVICKEYQNRQIGRKCVRDILLLAKQKKYKKVLANVYSFNKQSYHMFKEAGFLDLKDEWLVYYVPYEKTGLHVMPQADVDMLTLDKYEEGMN